MRGELGSRAERKERTAVLVPARRKSVTASSKFSSSLLRFCFITTCENSFLSAAVSGPFPPCCSTTISPISKREGDKTHSSSPCFKRLDENDHRRDMAVILAVHRRVVERSRVLDQLRERRVNSKIYQALRVRLNNCGPVSYPRAPRTSKRRTGQLAQLDP